MCNHPPLAGTHRRGSNTDTDKDTQTRPFALPAAFSSQTQAHNKDNNIDTEAIIKTNVRCLPNAHLPPSPFSLNITHLSPFLPFSSLLLFCFFHLLFLPRYMSFSLLYCNYFFSMPLLSPLPLLLFALLPSLSFSSFYFFLSVSSTCYHCPAIYISTCSTALVSFPVPLLSVLMSPLSLSFLLFSFLPFLCASSTCCHVSVICLCLSSISFIFLSYASSSLVVLLDCFLPHYASSFAFLLSSSSSVPLPPVIPVSLSFLATFHVSLPFFPTSPHHSICFPNSHFFSFRRFSLLLPKTALLLLQRLSFLTSFTLSHPSLAEFFFTTFPSTFFNHSMFSHFPPFNFLPLPIHFLLPLLSFFLSFSPLIFLHPHLILAHFPLLSILFSCIFHYSLFLPSFLLLLFLPLTLSPFPPITHFSFFSSFFFIFSATCPAFSSMTRSI